MKKPTVRINWRRVWGDPYMKADPLPPHVEHAIQYLVRKHMEIKP